MQRIVAFTGAGVSKASGIPTFEELPGIRGYLTRDYFRREPAGFYQKLWPLYLRVQQAQPNPAHLALAQANIPVITMNVDGLHRRAGTKDLVEIHGNLDWVSCPGCRKTEPFAVIQDRIDCPECRRILEPNVILYGDQITAYSRAAGTVEFADILLVIGTSFQTSTAAYIVNYARSRSCRMEIINDGAEWKVPEFIKENT